MPTIEIVSVNRKKRMKIPKGKYPFWVRQDLELVSHRGLFQEYLDKSQGVILHLGNNDFKNSYPFFFGSELINLDFESQQEDRFKFLQEHFMGIQNLIYRSWVSSPVKKAYFLTDIQMSEESNIKAEHSLVQLINEHNNIGLQWNTLYEIVKNQ